MECITDWNYSIFFCFLMVDRILLMVNNVFNEKNVDFDQQ